MREAKQILRAYQARLDETIKIYQWARANCTGRGEIVCSKPLPEGLTLEVLRARVDEVDQDLWGLGMRGRRPVRGARGARVLGVRYAEDRTRLSVALASAPSLRRCQIFYPFLSRSESFARVPALGVPSPRGGEHVRH